MILCRRVLYQPWHSGGQRSAEATKGSKGPNKNRLCGQERHRDYIKAPPPDSHAVLEESLQTGKANKPVLTENIRRTLKRVSVQYRNCKPHAWSRTLKSMSQGGMLMILLRPPTIGFVAKRDIKGYLKAPPPEAHVYHPRRSNYKSIIALLIYARYIMRGHFV